MPNRARVAHRMGPQAIRGKPRKARPTHRRHRLEQRPPRALSRFMASQVLGLEGHPGLTSREAIQ